MLPPLLSLLLDCAKKTDQTVVSISLGALVHLIEVGGHQFCQNDWDTLLKGIRYYICCLMVYLYAFVFNIMQTVLTKKLYLSRDASYTTQPLELLNSLGFDNSNSQTLNNGLHVSPHDAAVKDARYGSDDGEKTLDLASLRSDGEYLGNNASLIRLHNNQETNDQETLEGSQSMLLHVYFYS